MTGPLSDAASPILQKLMDAAQHLEARARPLAIAGFEACAETVCPPNDLGAPEVHDLMLGVRFDHWLDALPPESRRLMILLYTAMEIGAPLALPALSRLSRLPLARRTTLLERWRASPIMPLRFLVKAVKSPVVMMYLSEPSALRWLGAPAATWPAAADLAPRDRGATSGGTRGGEA